MKLIYNKLLSSSGFRSCNPPQFKIERMVLILKVNQQLQVLVAQINTCFRNLALPVLLLLFVFGNILSTNITVSMGSKLFANIGNLVFPLTLGLTIISIVLIGTFAGFVNKWSKDCINKFVKKCGMNIIFGSDVNNKRRSWLSKRVKCCSAMKIRFGSNFMETTTSLVMLGLCAKFAIRLMLLH